ncbi:choice-of-anchor G family protein, partial [Corynebacterium faecale]
MVSSANAATLPATYISLADGTLIDLSLFEPFLAAGSQSAFDDALVAVSAQQSWPADDGEPAQTSTLDIALLQAIEVEIGGINLPLVGSGLTTGLLDLGTPGVGVLSSFAAAPNATGAQAATGALTQDGFIDVDAYDGSGNIQTQIQLTSFLSQLGIADLTDQIIDDLSLRLGAVSSSAQEAGGTITAEYAIANAELNVHSPLLQTLSGSFLPGNVGAGLDAAVEDLADDSGLINGVLGLVNGALTFLGPLSPLSAVTDGPVIIDTDIENGLNTLLLEPLYNGPTPETSLVVLNLGTGDIQVNLEYLHGGNLSNLPANTGLLSAGEINQIVDAIGALLTDPATGLTKKIQDTVEQAILATEIEIPLKISLLPGLGGGVELAQVKIDGTLGDIINGAPGIVTGSLLGGTIELDDLLDAVIGVLNPVGNLIRTTLLEPTTGILNGVFTTINGVVNTLDPILQDILQNVLDITINEQPNVLTSNGQPVDGRPNAVQGTVTNATDPFAITAIKVDLLNLGGGAGTVSLPLATSIVAAEDSPIVTDLTIAPDNGPRVGGTTVTISNTRFGFMDDMGSPYPVDAVYVAGYRVSPVTHDEVAGTVTFTTPPWVDLNVVGGTVPITLGSETTRSEELQYSYTGLNLAEENEPGYDWLTIEAGGTKTVAQTWDADMPPNTIYSIDPTWRGLNAGWTITVEPSSGLLSVTAPTDAPIGLVFEVPVIATYEDGSSDRAPARVNVVTTPFGVKTIERFADYTRVTFTDDTFIDIPHGEDGVTPHIDPETGNWFIDTTDTGIPATGAMPHIDPETGNWFIGATDTGVKAQGPKGEDGDDGANGVDGATPTIGANGNWFIGATDTGVKAEGVDGLTPYIGANGNWFIGATDTGVKAEGVDGATPTIGANGNWFIGATDTGVKAEGLNGADGATPTIGANGNWFINGVDTGVRAEGQDGLDGLDGLTPYV